MKLVKGISLFIVFAGIFICGCYLGSAYKQFFYPGDTQKYLGVSQMKKQVITADTERDNFLSALEAKEYGLIDEVIDKRK